MRELPLDSIPTFVENNNPKKRSSTADSKGSSCCNTRYIVHILTSPIAFLLSYTHPHLAFCSSFVVYIFQYLSIHHPSSLFLLVIQSSICYNGHIGQNEKNGGKMVSSQSQQLPVMSNDNASGQGLGQGKDRMSRTTGSSDMRNKSK